MEQMQMNMPDIYDAALYLRLSKDDMEEGSAKSESNSIVNQRELLRSFVKSQPDIQIFDIYVDDGYSGGNFDRPEFKRMTTDIEAGKVNCVIVKDLSRFGREYIEAGRWIEKTYPALNVRFISVTDQFDSKTADFSEKSFVVPIKNFVNESYCRDISSKVRSHQKIKREKGEFIGAFAPYGYCKDSENKNCLVIDSYAADIVRKIFSWKIDGFSLGAIAEKLNVRYVQSPKAQANEPLDEEGYFIHKNVSGRFREETQEYERHMFDYMDVSPRMVFSVATALIPFLQNDDANRALMGSNMQRQAVPLLTTEAPVVGTGMEVKTAVDSGVCVVAKKSGTVLRSTSTDISIKNDDGTKDDYHLTKYLRSNQSNCYNQKPIVFQGEHVEAGQVIADGPSTANGELALGKNPLIGFMTWEGYNYEDAVLLSERLVMDDVYTSVHIEEYECEARDTKLGPEEITRDVPGVGDDALKDLDERGIIRIGAEVRAGDILVGKVTPKGETELTAEERLLRAIFGEKAREVRDTSLKVPHGEYGIIVDAKVFTRENGDEMSPGVNQSVRIYIAQKRKISVGDKMAGRHGNKGVVSRVLPVEDMPFLPNGRPLDIVLNPLGVPSRMNIGQVLEIHLSLAAKALGFNVATPIFQGANEHDIQDTLELANDYVNTEDFEEFREKYKDILAPDVMQYLDENKAHRALWKGVPISRDGKVRLRDGRTGEYFDSPVTIGHMHYLKLHHLVDDKIHARSTGPYSLVTQQPLGGKAQFGGQRFGEMEVWALEAYGASYTLQEILTVKSDDVVGRVKTYEAIIKSW